MKLLAAADIHLGRPPTHVAKGWDRRYSPAKAFDSLVSLAIDETVDGLLLAGDVADQDRLFHEAFGTLRRGAERLHEAGIPVVAVAGNHDTLILPELADALGPEKGFHLLGRGGTWSHYDLACRDGRTVRIWGWSFRTAACSDNPLDSFPGAGVGAPADVIGLLHANRGQTGGPYAPVPAVAFQASAVPFWVLGHIHAPDPVDRVNRSCYPGSLQARDPGEPGWHGALLVTGSAAAPTLARRRVSALRYESVTLDAAEIDGEAALLAALRCAAESRREADPGCQALSLRVVLTGETEKHPAELAGWAAGDAAGVVSLADDLQLYMDRVTVEVRPPLKLEELARGRDTVAALARLLQDLEGNAESDLAASLLSAGADALARVNAAGAFAPLQLRGDAPEPAEVRRLLRAQGYLLLRTLCAQREAQR